MAAVRPTVDEQLAGIDRLLQLVAADPRLSAESGSLLRDARRQLDRLRSSIELRLPFLLWDNAASAAVLAGVAPLLPPELADEVVAATARSEADPTAGRSETEADLARRNDRLRDLLSAAITALPDDEAGTAARAAIIDHLRARVDANPALNRDPVIPEETLS